MTDNLTYIPLWSLRSLLLGKDCDDDDWADWDKEDGGNGGGWGGLWLLIFFIELTIDEDLEGIWPASSISPSSTCSISCSKCI